MQPRPQSILESLQVEVHDTLLKTDLLRNIPLHTQSQSWSEAQICSRTEMTSGIHIRIHPPIPLHIEEGIIGPLFDDLDLCIEILEYPVSNVSGWSAIAAAEAICHQLHGLSLQASSWQGQLVCRTERSWEYQFEDLLNRIRIHFSATCAL